MPLQLVRPVNPGGNREAYRLRWERADVLTCTFLFHSAHALEPPEHTTQVRDAVLEGDFLVLAGFRILQQLPHVYLGLFLLRLHLPIRGEPLPSLIAAHWPLKTRKVGVWYRFFWFGAKSSVYSLST